MEENRGYRFLLMGLQEAAEASRSEVRAWEATFAEVLPPEEWHRGAAFEHLARHAIKTRRANELRCRGWQILGRLRQAGRLQREPEEIFYQSENERPLSVLFREVRQTSGALFRTLLRRGLEEEQQQQQQHQQEQPNQLVDISVMDQFLFTTDPRRQQ
jgi:hypothetical protein